MTLTALATVPVTKVISEQTRQTSDLIVSEVPLQIVLKYFDGDSYVEKPISVTMRSRGDDESLVIGFLYNEGVITTMDQVSMIRYCVSSENIEINTNRIIVTLVKSVVVDENVLSRNFITNSSCGVCGKVLVSQLVTNLKSALVTKKVTSDVLNKLPEKLYKNQLLFKYTGGIHACGLFDFEGNLQVLFEDIGRHNALDKVIGNILINRKLFSDTIIVMSGRVGYEMMQKSAKARIPVVLAIGAPTDLAVDIANRSGICLIGFAKEHKMNVYSHPNRISF